MNQYLDELRNNEYVREKDLGNSVHSFNYSNKAFFEGRWDNVTTRARGLFVDVNVDKVIARSFDKFFAIGERPETQLDSLKDTLKFPLMVYRKENGFLGICAYREGEKNNLFIASKSTNQGEYAEYFRNILNNIMSDKDQKFFADFLKNLNASAVFEVIDPINDPHIVEYKEQNLILLALIQNDYEYKPYSYYTLKEVGQLMRLKVKEWCGLIKDWNDFLYFLQAAKDEKETEGYVIEDRVGFMLKIKNNWYKYWKRIRSVGQAVYKGNLDYFVIKQKYRLQNCDLGLLNFLYELKKEMSAEEMKNIPLVRNLYLECEVPKVER